MEKKLDLILHKLQEMDGRLSNLEEKTGEIHEHVPFVKWLERIGSRINPLTLFGTRPPEINYDLPIIMCALHDDIE